VTAGAASEKNETSRDAAEAPRLVGLSTAPLVVAPIRIGLGLLGMAGAALRGLSWSVAAAEFVLGTAVFAFAALADPRRHFLGVAGAITGAQIAMRERVGGVRLYVERGGRRLFSAETTRERA